MNILGTTPGTEVTTSIIVPAGEPLSLGLIIVNGNAYCGIARAFTPAVGENYLLFAGDTIPTATGFWDTVLKGPEDGAKCFLAVAVKGADSKPIRVPTYPWPRD